MPGNLSSSTSSATIVEVITGTSTTDVLEISTAWTSGIASRLRGPVQEIPSTVTLRSTEPWIKLAIVCIADDGKAVTTTILAWASLVIVEKVASLGVNGSPPGIADSPGGWCRFTLVWIAETRTNAAWGLPTAIRKPFASTPQEVLLALAKPAIAVTVSPVPRSTNVSQALTTVVAGQPNVLIPLASGSAVVRRATPIPLLDQVSRLYAEISMNVQRACTTAVFRTVSVPTLLVAGSAVVPPVSYPTRPHQSKSKRSLVVLTKRNVLTAPTTAGTLTTCAANWNHSGSVRAKMAIGPLRCILG